MAYSQPAYATYGAPQQQPTAAGYPAYAAYPQAPQQGAYTAAGYAQPAYGVTANPGTGYSPAPQPQQQQPPQQSQPPAAGGGARPVDLDDLFDFGRPAAPAGGPPQGPPPPPVSQDPFFGYQGGGAPQAPPAPVAQPQPPLQQATPYYPAGPQPTGYPVAPPQPGYTPQAAPAAGYYAPPVASQQMPAAAPTAVPTAAQVPGAYDPSAVYGAQAIPGYAPPPQAGYTVVAAQPAGVIGAQQPILSATVLPPDQQFAVGGGAYPGFSHPGLQRPAVIPSQTVPSAVAPQQGSALSPEDEDRVQLERIRRLRQELEREQRREEQASQEKDTWACAQCTLRNPNNTFVCSACDHPRPGYASQQQKPQSSGPATTVVPSRSSQPGASSSQPTRTPASSERWTCNKCATQNSTAANLCKICDSPMPGSPTAGSQSSSGGGAAATSWNCPQCTYTNAIASSKCQMCEFARPAHLAPATVVSPPTPAVPTIWNCPQCTFENALSASKCTMCGTNAPANVPRPAIPAVQPVSFQQPTTATPALRTYGIDPRLIAQLQAAGYPPATIQKMIDAHQARLQQAGTVPPAAGGRSGPAASAPDSDDEDADDVRWQKDKDATRCNKCDSAFGLLNRRHHCRSCGFVFCNNCSSYKLKLKNGGAEERVCTDCYRGRTTPAPRATTTTAVLPPGISDATRRAVAPQVVAQVPCDCAMAAEGFHRASCPNKR